MLLSAIFLHPILVPAMLTLILVAQAELKHKPLYEGDGCVQILQLMQIVPLPKQQKQILKLLFSCFNLLYLAYKQPLYKFFGFRIIQLNTIKNIYGDFLLNNMKISSIEKRILSKIKPSPEEEERMNKIANEVMGVLVQSFEGSVEIFLGGSFGKGTWISGNHDIDVYVMFDNKVFSKKDISILLEEKLKILFPEYEKIHGSRDYFQ